MPISALQWRATLPRGGYQPSNEKSFTIGPGGTGFYGAFVLLLASIAVKLLGRSNEIREEPSGRCTDSGPHPTDQEDGSTKTNTTGGGSGQGRYEELSSSSKGDRSSGTKPRPSDVKPTRESSN